MKKIEIETALQEKTCVVRQVTHLEIDGKHYYFGSPKSMFDRFDEETLGITRQALNNHFCRLDKSEEMEYKNKKCIIRKGILYVSDTPRGRKPMNITKSTK